MSDGSITIEIENQDQINDEQSSILHRITEIMKNPFTWIILVVCGGLMGVIIYIGSFSAGPTDLSAVVVQGGDDPRLQASQVPTGAIVTDSTPVSASSEAEIATPTRAPMSLGLTNAPTPTGIPTATPDVDRTPPTTTVLSPTQGGEIASRIDGNICILLAPPRDDRSPVTDITTFYSFDSEAMTSTKATGLICKSQLFNGLHTFAYYSQDTVGNKENQQTLTFSVKIEGNEPTPTLVPSATPTMTTTPPPSPTPAG